MPVINYYDRQWNYVVLLQQAPNPKQHNPIPIDIFSFYIASIISLSVISPCLINIILSPSILIIVDGILLFISPLIVASILLSK